MIPFLLFIQSVLILKRPIAGVYDRTLSLLGIFCKGARGETGRRVPQNDFG